MENQVEKERREQNLYHTVLLFGERVDKDTVEKLLENFRSFLTSCGGENLTITPLGRKKLAYTIKKNQYGEYYLLEYTLPPNGVKALTDLLRVTPEIIRFMTFRGKGETEKEEIHHLNTDLLKNYITERGKIRNGKQNRFPAKTQRKLARAIKRARILGFLPFTTLTST